MFGQNLDGKYVSHEIDVIASNKQKTILVENISICYM